MASQSNCDRTSPLKKKNSCILYYFSSQLFILLLSWMKMRKKWYFIDICRINFLLALFYFRFYAEIAHKNSDRTKPSDVEEVRRLLQYDNDKDHDVMNENFGKKLTLILKMGWKVVEVIQKRSNIVGNLVMMEIQIMTFLVKHEEIMWSIKPYVGHFCCV